MACVMFPKGVIKYMRRHGWIEVTGVCSGENDVFTA